jgi:hypothetical protein
MMIAGVDRIIRKKGKGKKEKEKRKSPLPPYTPPYRGQEFAIPWLCKILISRFGKSMPTCTLFPHESSHSHSFPNQPIFPSCKALSAAVLTCI